MRKIFLDFHLFLFKLNKFETGIWFLHPAVMFGILCLLLVAVAQRVATVSYPCNASAPCGCSANPVVTSRILGGEAAANLTWGWAVSLSLNGTSMCGGTLISSSWILTAAGCTNYYPASEILISAATNELLGWIQWRRVSLVIKHPAYNTTTGVNDIALLRMSAPFDMTNPSIARICLPIWTSEDDPSINSSVSWERFIIWKISDWFILCMTVGCRRLGTDQRKFVSFNNLTASVCATYSGGPGGLPTSADWSRCSVLCFRR